MHAEPIQVLLILGGVASVFFGFAACTIFSVKWPQKWAARVYLFWFNFCGSAVGWASLAVLGERYPWLVGGAPKDVAFTDFLLALVAFAGLTGHLPMATMGIFKGLADITKGLLGKWFGAAA